jgi:hypothetical protein
MSDGLKGSLFLSENKRAGSAKRLRVVGNRQKDRLRNVKMIVRLFERYRRRKQNEVIDGQYRCLAETQIELLDVSGDTESRCHLDWQVCWRGRKGARFMHSLDRAND